MLLLLSTPCGFSSVGFVLFLFLCCCFCVVFSFALLPLMKAGPACLSEAPFLSHTHTRALSHWHSFLLITSLFFSCLSFLVSCCPAHSKSSLTALPWLASCLLIHTRRLVSFCHSFSLFISFGFWLLLLSRSSFSSFSS